MKAGIAVSVLVKPILEQRALDVETSTVCILKGPAYDGGIRL